MWSPGERGFADNLGEESWVSVLSREGSATSALASPLGPMGTEILGLGGKFVPGLSLRWMKQLPEGTQIVTGGGLAPLAETQWHAAAPRFANIPCNLKLPKPKILL